MINVETIIGNILQPLRDTGDVGFYHFGNEDELKEVFASKKYNLKYPFVWLVMPFDGSPKEFINKKEIDLRLKLILATTSTKDWLNDKRNIETYDKVLNPLYDNVIKTFTKNTQIIIKNNEVDVKKLHNYYQQEQGTRSNPPKRQVLDYWDVILVEFNAVVKARVDCEVKQLIPTYNTLVLDGNLALVLDGNLALILR